MQKYFLMLMAIAMFGCKNNKTEEEVMTYPYPETMKADQVDVYFGTEVKDPYVWLEDESSQEVHDWVDAQNKVTQDYLASFEYREKIKERITKLWNYPKYGIPHKKGDFYFFSKNDGLQAQSVFYMQKGLDGEAEVLLDPNTLSEDGTVALATYSISNDHKYLAYGISRQGSDWNEFFVMDIESKELMNDHLEWIKFSGISWYKNGFFYSRYDEPKEGQELSGKNEFHKVYYHELGTTQDQDELIFWDPKAPLRGFYVQVTEDEKFLILHGSESTSGGSLHFKNLEKGDDEFTAVDKSFEYEYSIIGNLGDSLYIKTNYKADNYRLICIHTDKLSENDWYEIIPEKDIPMQSISMANEKLIVEYMENVVSKAYVFDLSGKYLSEVKFPGPGSVSGFSACKDDSLAFYSFTSFTYPSTIFKYDIANNESEIYKQSEIDIDLEEYESKQVFYESKDGTKVPMFLTYKKGLVLNGTNPVMLYGYGGFNISLTPGFSVTNIVFLENGGIYAQANLRGGGEYGDAWHHAGWKLNKQNVFDDFISAAEYLIAEKYTSSEKIAIRGGSNGGLLVGACMTQRPDLFKVAIPEVGVLDMLKFHNFSAGFYWEKEYGSSKDSAQFKYLLAYSPLHNLQEDVDYPATLVVTGDHDNRVVPAHSYKYIATLQEKYRGDNPVMLRVEKDAGHGAGKPTEKIIELYTDIWTFVFANLGIESIYK